MESRSAARRLWPVSFRPRARRILGACPGDGDASAAAGPIQRRRTCNSTTAVCHCFGHDSSIVLQSRFKHRSHGECPEQDHQHRIVAGRWCPTMSAQPSRSKAAGQRELRPLTAVNTTGSSLRRTAQPEPSIISVSEAGYCPQLPDLRHSTWSSRGALGQAATREYRARAWPGLPQSRAAQFATATPSWLATNEAATSSRIALCRSIFINHFRQTGSLDRSRFSYE